MHELPQENLSASCLNPQRSSSTTLWTYLTTDNLESNFAINYLANFLSILLILESMDKNHSRTIMISSAMHEANHWMNISNFPVGEKEMFADIEEIKVGDVGLGEEDTEKEKEVAS